ncbi:MAG: class II aldolase/adducin family protein, partial [Alistipes sp.]
MKYNNQLTTRIAEVAEVAGYLWQKGWAERNGGNISYNITDVVDDAVCGLKPISEDFLLARPVTNLCGHYFLVTGTNKRMRYVHSSPMENMSIIRIAADGTSYAILAEQPIHPTSELP